MKDQWELGICRNQAGYAMIRTKNEVVSMDFYTAVLRKSGSFWVALCLENGIVGQGNIKESAMQKLKEAIQSFQDIQEDDSDVYSAPLSIKELHEFLTVEEKGPVPESYELRAVNA
jgi:predicted RNase H-like HicB family nuclease